MKAISKKLAALAACALVAVAPLALRPAEAAAANSAQTSWSGLSSAGAVVADGQCPVVVESEKLTFDISSFPSNYYDTVEEFAAYDARVTAEYALYNPADYAVTVNLAFPFGKLPSYAYGLYADGDYDPAAGSAYAVAVDGEEVQKILRHTYSSAYSDYDNETDKARLRSGYMQEGLFAPSTPVTIYNYTVTASGEPGRYASLTAPFPSFHSSSTALVCSLSDFNYEEKRISMSCTNGQSFSVYILGEAIDPIVWSVENGSCTLDDKTVSTTLGELAAQTYDSARGVSEADWFNAVCDQIIDSGRDFGEGMCFYECDSFFVDPENLLRWYAYSVTLPAGGRAVNSVTAPVYPELDTDDDICRYTYLLSPAADWADFGTLEIIIESPYFVNHCSLGRPERTEEGYRMSFDSLPDSELTFILSAEDTWFEWGYPTHRPYNDMTVWLIACCTAAAAVAAGVGAWLVVRAVRRRRDEGGAR